MEDFDTHFNSANYSHVEIKNKHRITRMKHRKYKRYLVKLANESGGFPSGAYLKTKFRDKTYKPRYMRIWRSQSSKGIKRDCNQKFRRDYKHSDEILSRGAHHKSSEFWWEYS